VEDKTGVAGSVGDVMSSKSDVDAGGDQLRARDTAIVVDFVQRLRAFGAG